MNLPRLMWTLYEPIHSVTYFSSEARQHFEAAGLRGFWRGYFAGRAAPLGPVDAAPVVAAFFNFAPGMVARALPEVWQRATPAEVLAARTTGATTALTRACADLPAPDVTEAADRLAEVAARLDIAGRVLGAGNGALPVPEEPLARLWQAATTLREHRGDGHVAALVASGLNGCDVLVWRAASDITRQTLQPNRGWSDEEWEESVRRLQRRGWLDGAGRPTDAGIASFQEIEAITDRVCAPAWDGVAVERLRTLLSPLAEACWQEIPAAYPVGLPPPGGDADRT
jgi:hypothetical protein